MENHIKLKINAIYLYPPSIEYCRLWLKNHRKIPGTHNSLISGSTLWYYWAYWTMKYLNIDLKHCYSKSNPLKWFQDGLGIYNNNNMKLCDTCHKNSLCAYINHIENGDICCALCNRRAQIVFCCMLCSKTPIEQKIIKTHSIEKLMKSYHKELQKQGIRYKPRGFRRY